MLAYMHTSTMDPMGNQSISKLQKNAVVRKWPLLPRLHFFPKDTQHFLHLVDAFESTSNGKVARKMGEKLGTIAEKPCFFYRDNDWKTMEHPETMVVHHQIERIAVKSWKTEPKYITKKQCILYIYMYHIVSRCEQIDYLYTFAYCFPE